MMALGRGDVGAQSVLQEHDRLVEMANDDVRSAVVVEIAEGGAAANVLGTKIIPGLIRHILKTNSAWNVTGLTKVTQQHSLLTDFDRRVRIAHHVAVGDEDVLGAVAVEIEK